MKQSLLKEHWLHTILFMCFSELVLAGLGKAGAVYPYQLNVSYLYWGDLGCLVCVGAWGGSPACSVGMLSCS